MVNLGSSSKSHSLKLITQAPREGEKCFQSSSNSSFHAAGAKPGAERVSNENHRVPALKELECSGIMCQS